MFKKLSLARKRLITCTNRSCVFPTLPPAFFFSRWSPFPLFCQSSTISPNNLRQPWQLGWTLFLRMAWWHSCRWLMPALGFFFLTGFTSPPSKGSSKFNDVCYWIRTMFVCLFWKTDVAFWETVFLFFFWQAYRILRSENYNQNQYTHISIWKMVLKYTKNILKILGAWTAAVYWILWSTRSFF